MFAMTVLMLVMRIMVLMSIRIITSSVSWRWMMIGWMRVM
jgi:hypothetical protein